MAPQPPPHGVYVPVLAFFHEDETIDYDTITQHINRLLASGVRGLVIHGSHGEATHLLPDERAAIIRHARSLVEKSGTNATIIAGCSANSVRETIMIIQAAKDAGADYALTLPPNYWAAAMTKPVIESFYLKVAESSALPLLIYNNPAGASGIDLDSDLITSVAKQSPDVVVGCKLSCGNIAKLTRIAASLDASSFTPLSGKADVLLASLVAGSGGAISAVANVTPKVLVEVMRLYEAGDLEGARRIQGDLSHADWAMQKLGISGVKAACVRWFGYGSAMVRAPLPLAQESSLETWGPPLQKVVDLERKLTATG